MSASDKIRYEAEDLKGKAKETIGNATNDDKLVGEGEADQTQASLKKAAENVKDAITK